MFQTGTLNSSVTENNFKREEVGIISLSVLIAGLPQDPYQTDTNNDTKQLQLQTVPPCRATLTCGLAP